MNSRRLMPEQMRRHGNDANDGLGRGALVRLSRLKLIPARVNTGKVRTEHNSSRFILGEQTSERTSFSGTLRAMWTAETGRELFTFAGSTVGCSHVFGLFARLHDRWP